MSEYTTPFEGDNPPSFPADGQVWVDTSVKPIPTIWKYELPLTPGESFSISVPGGSLAEVKPLTVQLQRGFPCLWIEVDISRKSSDWELFWVFTGFSPPRGFSYIGTVQVQGSLTNEEIFVFHLYGRRAGW